MEGNFNLENIIELMNFDTKDYLQQIMKVVQQMTQEKFVNGIVGALDEYKSKVIEGNDKEIELIKAIKPFFDKEQSKNLDMATNLLSNYKALKHILNDVQQVQSKNKSVKMASINHNNQSNKEKLVEEKNTVYEIDEECEQKIKTTNIFGINLLPLLLFFILFMNK